MCIRDRKSDILKQRFAQIDEEGIRSGAGLWRDMLVNDPDEQQKAVLPSQLLQTMKMLQIFVLIDVLYVNLMCGWDPVATQNGVLDGISTDNKIKYLIYWLPNFVHWLVLAVVFSKLSVVLTIAGLAAGVVSLLWHILNVIFFISSSPSYPRGSTFNAILYWLEMVLTIILIACTLQVVGKVQIVAKNKYLNDSESGLEKYGMFTSKETVLRLNGNEANTQIPGSVDLGPMRNVTTDNNQAGPKASPTHYPVIENLDGTLPNNNDPDGNMNNNNMNNLNPNPGGMVGSTSKTNLASSNSRAGLGVSHSKGNLNDATAAAIATTGFPVNKSLDAQALADHDRASVMAQLNNNNNINSKALDDARSAAPENIFDTRTRGTQAHLRQLLILPLHLRLIIILLIRPVSAPKLREVSTALARDLVLPPPLFRSHLADSLLLLAPTMRLQLQPISQLQLLEKTRPTIQTPITTTLMLVEHWLHHRRMDCPIKAQFRRQRIIQTPSICILMSVNEELSKILLEVLMGSPKNRTRIQ
eukprot:TRINITY_DN8915_c0_g1_i5.p1 TRINITY_DN8915_c0_g1~~TRINITY_DN8915_c0_g1_i5.p1  ORF type:complete len:549 (-),score=43.03 TRINITY_DN8915_c0_g1_i5:237-1823(-)